MRGSRENAQDQVLRNSQHLKGLHIRGEAGGEEGGAAVGQCGNEEDCKSEVPTKPGEAFKEGVALCVK